MKLMVSLSGGAADNVNLEYPPIAGRPITVEELRAVIPNKIAKALDIPSSSVKGTNVELHDSVLHARVPATRYTMIVPGRKGARIPFTFYLYSIGFHTVINDGVSYRMETRSTADAIRALKQRVNAVKDM